MTFLLFAKAAFQTTIGFLSFFAATMFCAVYLVTSVIVAVLRTLLMI